MAMGGTPLLILKEGTKREKGREAKLDNIFAAKAVADAVRSTLGPRGMDKMLVDSQGDVIITNDGVTIAKEMDVQHPAAKMMVEVAKALDQECGDGTTTAMVLAGALLGKAEDLTEMDIHPTVISRGYKMAASRALEKLEDLAIPVGLRNREMLRDIAMTAMMSKAVSEVREHLANIVVKAIGIIAENIDERTEVDLDNIQIVKKQGLSANETSIISGMILDKGPVMKSMPHLVNKACIALISGPLEVKKTEVSATIQITDPTQMHAFLEEEERMLHDMVRRVQGAGANVLVCEKKIDDLAQHFLSKEGIMCFQNVQQSVLVNLAKATGGNIVDRASDLEMEDLGHSGRVEVKRVEESEMTFILECKNPKATAIFIRGGTQHVIDEEDRSLDDALNVVAITVEDGLMTAGGGATAVELAMDLREYANSIGGREQMAISAFASALEAVPTALAENAGMDPIDMLIDLRKAHKDGHPHMGVNVLHGGIADMKVMGVVEPVRLSRQQINSAVDVAIMVVRIDDVIASKGAEGPPGPP